MKKKIIFGLLAIGLLLFFSIFSWALDYDSYLKSRHQEHPDQELFRTPVIPQSSTPMQSITKIILIPTGQTFPALIYVKQSSLKTQDKVRDLARNSAATTSKTAKTK